VTARRSLPPVASPARSAVQAGSTQATAPAGSDVVRRRREHGKKSSPGPLRSLSDPCGSLDLSIAEETERSLPEIVGGLTLALACTFKIIDPRQKNPDTEHWKRTIALFDLLL
jgi:hypothetical protein